MSTARPANNGNNNSGGPRPYIHTRGRKLAAPRPPVVAQKMPNVRPTIEKPGYAHNTRHPRRQHADISSPPLHHPCRVYRQILNVCTPRSSNPRQQCHRQTTTRVTVPSICSSHPSQETRNSREHKANRSKENHYHNQNNGQLNYSHRRGPSPCLWPNPATKQLLTDHRGCLLRRDSPMSHLLGSARGPGCWLLLHGISLAASASHLPLHLIQFGLHSWRGGR